MYREFCGARQLDPEVEKELLTPRTLINLVFDLMHEWAPAEGTDQVRVARGWDRFLDALKDALAVPIHPNAAVAFKGELYVATWKGRKPGFDRAKIIRVKSGKDGDRWDKPLLKYWFVYSSKVEPTIEIRTDLRELVKNEDRIHGLASRWRTRGPGSTSLGATAVRVYPERIEDMARMAAALLRGGEMRGIRMRGQLIEITEA